VTPAGLQEDTPEPLPVKDVEAGDFTQETASSEKQSPQPPLLYEFSAQELPPAEIEPAQEYPGGPETREPQVLGVPEGADDVQLPYEARRDEKGVGAGAAAGRESDEQGSKDVSRGPERSGAKKDKEKPKSAAAGSGPQPRLPGMD
jgi:hypothetical protein